MKREYVRTGTGLIIMLVGVFFFMTSDPPWTTPRASTILYSVLAFLAVAIAASAANRIRINPSRANRMFAAGTTYAAVIFGGASVFYILSTEPLAAHARTAGVALNLVALATTSVYMLIFIHLANAKQNDDSVWNRPMTCPLAVVLGLVAFGAMMVVSRAGMDKSVYLTIGYVMGAIALFSYGVAAVATLMRKRQVHDQDSYRLGLSFMFLAAAAGVDVYVMPSPSSFWLWSICFIAMAFILALVATAYPYLKDIGIQEGVAYTTSILISVIVIVPFLVTAFVDSYFPFDLIIDYGTTIVIHAGGAVLAASLSYVLFRRSRFKPKPHHQSIIMLFQVWAVAEVVLILTYLAPLLGIEVAPLVPFITGVAATLLLLTLAFRTTLRPPQKLHYPTLRYHFSAILLFILVIAGIGVARLSLSSMFPLLFNRSIDMSILLILSYFALSALITFILVLMASSGRDFALAGVSALYVTVWLVVSILKANFLIWTMGWWAADVLLAIFVAVFPLIMVRFYIQGAEKNVDFERRADIYSEYVSSRIIKHHQTAMDSLEVLSRKPHVSDEFLQSVSRALTELSTADELTRSLTAVLSADRFSPDTMEQFDLVKSILTAYEKLKARHPEIPEELALNRNTGECSVLGNSLLVDLFYNLLQGVASRIGGIESTRIRIEGIDEECSHFLVEIQLDLSTDEPTLKQELLTRYMEGHDPSAIEFAYAERLVELFGGQVSYDAFSEMKNHLSVVFSLILPGSQQTLTE